MSTNKETNPKDALASGRVPMDLALDSVNLALAAALAEGAMKYGRYNWRVMGARASVYQGALRRHMMAWWNGEDIDPDSGLPHLYKAVACLAILIDAEVNGVLVDDRPPSLIGMKAAMADVETAVKKMREKHAALTPRHYTIADPVRHSPAKGYAPFPPSDRTAREVIERLAVMPARYTDAKE